MHLSLSRDELSEYVAGQLNSFFPDRRPVDAHDLKRYVDVALERTDHCFKHSSFSRYFQDGSSRFNHLYSDHYVVFLWLLSNSLWKERGGTAICDKIYCLNKTLHGLNCMYDAALPDIFLLFHTVGTVLGKAEYADFFVALHGCTVGAHKGKYPVMGKGVALAANSAVIGDCRVGDRVSIGVNTAIFQKDVPSDTTAYTNEEGRQIFKTTNESYAQSFFNVSI